MSDALSVPMNLPIDLTGNLPGASLDAYIQRCHAIPMLTQEQELSLARRFHDDGDLDAARQLVLSHLRFVVRVAKGYAGYGLGVGDLIQEGNIGLMKAVKRFDPDVGVRLVSFAVHWIRAEMHEFIIRNWRIVKIATTKAQRKLFFNLRSQKKRLGWMNQAEVQAVADDLGVSAKDVLEMEMRLSSHDPSFDPPSADDEGGTSPAYYLEDLRFNPEQQVAYVEDDEYQTNALRSGIDQLDARSQAIVKARWLSENKVTLQELAKRFDISAERVRQLEAAALKKLRNLLPART